MTRWAAFAGVTLAVLVLLLLLARASQSLVSGGAGGAGADAGFDPGSGAELAERGGRWLDALPDDADHLDAVSAGADHPDAVSGGADHPDALPDHADRTDAFRAVTDRADGPTSAGPATEPEHGRTAATRDQDGHRAAPAPSANVPTLVLLANVAASHGIFALILLGGIWLTDVPASALGVTADPLSTGPPAVAVGLAVGVALALANTLAAGLAKAFGVDPSEDLRSLLAPETLAGWAVLLLVVLPVIAGFEELLFRAALIGGFAAGFDVSPWLLAVLSSAAFAAGHGAQGGVGVVVTGMLGLVLAVVFVLTGSLVVVVVAHYVVNAAEFVVAEGVGWEPW